MAKKKITQLGKHKFIPADKLPKKVTDLSGIDSLRVVRYSDFTDLEWQLALKWAERRRLDPLVGQVHFFKKYSLENKSQEVSYMVGIEGMRLIADRTGTLGGAGKCDFEYDAKGNVTSATFYSEKLVNGEWRTVIGRAHREEYLTGAMGSFALDYPKAHLEKCAEAACYRRGWPQELGHIYCEEELKTMKAKAAEKPSQHIDHVDDIPPDDCPTIDLPN